MKNYEVTGIVAYMQNKTIFEPVILTTFFQLGFISSFMCWKYVSFSLIKFYRIRTQTFFSLISETWPKIGFYRLQTHRHCFHMIFSLISFHSRTKISVTRSVCDQLVIKRLNYFITIDILSYYILIQFVHIQRHKRIWNLLSCRICSTN